MLLYYLDQILSDPDQHIIWNSRRRNPGMVGTVSPRKYKFRRVLGVKIFFHFPAQPAAFSTHTNGYILSETLYKAGQATLLEIPEIQESDSTLEWCSSYCTAMRAASA
jgi:hypothetical protein